jgi:hypothetical protein
MFADHSCVTDRRCGHCTSTLDVHVSHSGRLAGIPPSTAGRRFFAIAIAYYPPSVQRAGTEKRRVPFVCRHIVHYIPAVVKATENAFERCVQSTIRIAHGGKPSRSVMIRRRFFARLEQSRQRIIGLPKLLHYPPCQMMHKCVYATYRDTPQFASRVYDISAQRLKWPRMPRGHAPRAVPRDYFMRLDF